MKLTSKEIQHQFEGFVHTSCLWNEKAIYTLKQFKIEQKSPAFNLEIDTKLRLGKYIERFVSFQLEQEESTTIISENIQIQKEKITLGELDCILLKDKKPVHLEIIYKFYLYDTTFGSSEIEHFIGPNRKDSLVEKLVKLKDKQLPLLYSEACKTYLKTIPLEFQEIEQQVYFKAQLFVPYSNRNLVLKELNQNCIAGFYINQKELENLRHCKFYIPTKKEWLVIPHTKVDWLNFSPFKENSNHSLERQFSPLCWAKNPNGTLQKFFLIWW